MIFDWLRDWWKRRKSGYIRSPFDFRDHRFKPSGTPLKKRVDLRKYFLPARDQKYSQACTAFAVTALLEYRMRRIRKTPKGQYYLSVLYNWYYGRELHGWEDENKGVWLRNTFKALYAEGVPPEDKMPFNAAYYKQQPDYDSEAFGELFKKYLSNTHYTLLRALDVKESLNKGNPVVCGIKLNNSFYGNKDGIIKDISASNNSHAIVILGYDDNTECYIARNSWNTSWGDHGDCYIPYAYFEKNTHEIRVIEEND